MTLNIRDGLIAEYLFVGSEATVTDTGGVYDADGTFGNGGILGSDMFGRQNRAYDFSGSSEYISAALGADVDLYSLSVWFHNDVDTITGTTNNTALSWDTTGVAYGGLYYGSFTGNFLNEVITLAQSSNTKDYYWDSTAVPVSLMTIGWHHIVCIREGTTYRLYLDGVDKGLATEYGSPPILEMNDIRIGGNETSGNYFNGKVGEIKMWNRSLTATEALQLYNGVKYNYQGLFDGLLAGYDFKGNALDFSGNGNDGTVTGASLGSDRFNIINSAYDFNGSSDYITHPLVSIDSGIQSYSFWTKTTATANEFIIDADVTSGANDRLLIQIDVTTGKLSFYGRSQSAESVTRASTSSINDNAWHHIVVIIDVGGDAINIYIDGALNQGSQTGTFASTIDTLGTNYIAKYFGGSSNYYTGSISEIKIWNRILSADEVLQLYELSSKKNLYPYKKTGGLQ